MDEVNNSVDNFTGSLKSSKEYVVLKRWHSHSCGNCPEKWQCSKIVVSDYNKWNPVNDCEVHKVSICDRCYYSECSKISHKNNKNKETEESSESAEVFS